MRKIARASSGSGLAWTFFSGLVWLVSACGSEQKALDASHAGGDAEAILPDGSAADAGANASPEAGGATLDQGGARDGVAASDTAPTLDTTSPEAPSAVDGWMQGDQPETPRAPDGPLTPSDGPIAVSDGHDSAGPSPDLAADVILAGDGESNDVPVDSSPMPDGPEGDATGDLGGSASVDLMPEASPTEAGATPRCTSTQTTAYLARVMDEMHERFYVYKDKDSAANHFAARGRMSSDTSPGESPYVPSMNEGDVTHCDSDAGTCIEARFVANGSNWGGWYFMNGVLAGNDRGPSLNWGTEPDAGIDLRGASKLTFRARGAVGGERVQFFAFGVGRPDQPYPDSSATKSRPYDTLTATWQTYEIDLAGLDLGYVLGGFGWVTNAPENNGNAITFYLDDIYYDKDTRDRPRFLASYQTLPTSSESVDTVLRNVAYTYDNAVALMHFLSVGETTRAQLVADALVYAQNHDRYFTDGRLRNAYQAGELVLPPGWNPSGIANTVRMPGFSDASGLWSEDAVQVGSYTGNVAWAALALLSAHARLGGTAYRDAAVRLASWVEGCCRVSDTLGGYAGGFEGWERDASGAPQEQTRLFYRSTEHNLDLYALFTRLATLTGDSLWTDRASHARRFVEAMWNPSAGHFWTGTRGASAGDSTINTAVVPLDAQSWTLLALRDWQTDTDRLRAVEFAEDHCGVGNGFDFDSDATGIWVEGTAQMASLYSSLGRASRRELTMTTVESLRDASGGFPAVAPASLAAGPDSSPWWIYYHRLHVGASAWVGFAECGLNPFWFE